MLTDKDFDEIGKRLYDHEAEPPGNGWDRIRPGIIPPVDTPKGNKPWNKNWWKPLVILIPVGLYLIWPEIKLKEATPPTLIVEETQGLNELSTANSDVEKTLTTASLGYNINRDDNQLTNDPPVIERTETISRPSNNADKNTAKKRSAPENESEINLITDIAPAESGIAEREFILNNETSSPDGESAKAMAPGSTNKKERDIEKSEILANNRSRVSDGHVDDLSEKQMLTEKENLFNQNSFGESSNKNSVSLHESDTVEKIVREPKQVELSERPLDQKAIAEEKNHLNRWRITAGFAPQFLNKSIRPLGSDEVLVTEVKRKSAPEKIGYGFFAGAGKALGTRFYIDGQISFSRLTQTIGYSYATGKVDTLLATMHKDGNVRLTPVYQVTSEERVNQFTYSGLRISGNYYFWENAKRRFNISATGGLNYLIASNLKHKINDTWMTSSADGIRKMNFIFSVGGGYNITLTKGIELMINPTITYYQKKNISDEQPFKLLPRSYGLNIMLSKYL